MTSQRETIELVHDCPAYLIPEGIPIRLEAGDKVIVTQALGGDITVYTGGNLAQIFASDAHLLAERYRHTYPQESPDTPLEEQVWKRLRTCYDPEIPVNIVDLGLVYDCKVFKDEAGQNSAAVKMTLTAPACGMGPILAEGVKHRLLSIDGLDRAEVEIVFDPPWGQEMMSDAAKLELGFL